MQGIIFYHITVSFFNYLQIIKYHRDDRYEETHNDTIDQEAKFYPEEKNPIPYIEKHQKDRGPDNGGMISYDLSNHDYEKVYAI